MKVSCDNINISISEVEATILRNLLMLGVRAVVCSDVKAENADKTGVLSVPEKENHKKFGVGLSERIENYFLNQT